MKLSLLQKENDSGKKMNIIFDLSIDRSVSAFCSDRKKTEYFLSVISKPLTNLENIRYRQQILEDFIEFPKLFEELKTVFLRYDKIKSDWIELRSSSHVSASENTSALLDYTYSSLKVTAIFPKTILSFYIAIHDAIAKYDIKSEGLKNVLEYCSSMMKNKSLEEIADIASLFQYNTPEDYSFDVLIKLTSDLNLEECDICNIAEKPVKRRQERLQREFEKSLAIRRGDDVKQGGISSIFNFSVSDKADKKEKENSRVVDIEREAYDNVMYILTEALYRIDAVLTKITNDVYEVFNGLSLEMMFYDVALSYCSAVSEGEVPLLLPDVVEAERDIIDVKCLRDLFLISEGLGKEKIIPNDVYFSTDSDGAIIRGANNTGKTVYLRSIGTAQVFAQAGLPICAEKAVISIRNGIFSHFSAAEEEFVTGDTAGRFEGEVRAVGDIIDNIKPYSLVLLNETFQTTAYDEGAEGIYHILMLFPKIHTRYIFVTHLLRLFEKCDENRVVMLQTRAFDFSKPALDASASDQKTKYKLIRYVKE